MPSQSLLQKLRELSAIDCDTLDSEVAKDLGPFVDCTSNQAIAFFELAKTGIDGIPVHEKLIKESIRDAHWMLSQQSDTTLEELAVEFMMVRLALDIVPNLSGYSHIQTNPRWSYNLQKTIKNAERIVSIFKHLSAPYDTKRVCIKIPATWEGLQACRELEKRGIATLATTLFCMEQAAMAAHANCTYIAPYVNELKVHFEKGYVDENKAFVLCGLAQRYYRDIKARTRVLPASLTSIDEVLQLAGVDHITVSPPLLTELAATAAQGYQGDIGSVMKAAEAAQGDGKDKYEVILEDESAWRLAFTRSEGGKSEGKIIQAINIFYEMQENLEAIVTKMDTLA
ncbi:Transaldolase [Cytospora mali]|uniref:Transaldolase n=1 Tax=Cytospora mali TaxID=578113 RepID=A0A194UVY1_CYTMA|nr:Transaldolase [Valsa mali var. pyri (nom. inval.)]